VWRGKQGAVTAYQGTAEERRNDNNNQDRSNTRQPETFSYSPSKHSSVKRREDRLAVHADARENDKGDDHVEGPRPLETDSKDVQESSTVSASASTLRGGSKIVMASGAIAQDAAEASEAAEASDGPSPRSIPHSLLCWKQLEIRQSDGLALPTPHPKFRCLS
jgi:hypothetical protein